MMQRIALGLVLALGACKAQAEKKPTPAEVTSSLLDDVSPLDSASAMPTATGQAAWDPAFCDTAPEKERGASFSELAVTGTCNFQFTGSALCNARGDDYYAILRRKLRDGNELSIYINVEYYTGPGTYDRKVEMLALVRRGQALYRWSNTQATVTVAESAMALELTPTILNAEPGTPTTGAITLAGPIGCVMKPLPQ